MSRFLLAAIAWVAAASLPAAAQNPLPPHPITQTFFVANVTTDADVTAIAESLKSVKSVTKVDSLSPTSGYANVSFDSHANSFHEIAQSIVAAGGTEGGKYDVTIKIRVPDYAKGENAARIDEIFAKAQDLVTMKVVDKEVGEFVLHFLPLKVDPNRTGPQGWNMGRFYHPIHDPAPKGLGLEIRPVRLAAAAVSPAPAPAPTSASATPEAPATPVIPGTSTK